MREDVTQPASIDFCGEVLPLPKDKVLIVGREGDLVIDEDNPYLHRRFLALSWSHDLVWIENLGNQISATLADESGLAQTWLAPGARIPVVFPRAVVYFTAGPTTYEFEIAVVEPPYAPMTAPDTVSDGTTIGRVSLTPDQKLLCLVLAEDVLRRGVHGRGEIPASSQAAAKLGWTITKYNRKLDNVCEKFARLGVRGLTGRSGESASSRRSRLVEYMLASRLLTVGDLPLLEAAAAAAASHGSVRGVD